MKKEVKINYSYVEGEFLVQFFEDGLMVKWMIENDSKLVFKHISKFYFTK